MISHGIKRLLLCAVAVCSSAFAWGPTFDRMRTGFRRPTLLKDSIQDDFDSWRQSLDDDSSENIFSLPLHNHGEVFLCDESISDDGSPLVDWRLELSFQGDECEECLIPEEFKNKEHEMIDVMAFLGIRRAAPIQVNPELLAWQ